MNPEVDLLERELGSRVRDIRIAAGLSQDEVARRANLSRSTVHSLETGGGSSLSTLVRVLRVLDRTDWLEMLEAPRLAFDPLAILAEQQRRATKPVAPRVKRSSAEPVR